ncbi:MAG: TlpA family protein disulfide reductase [Myxococcales bacterium]|nr:TlpA family protein disulfide reductase [Myxococcales bacterium]
MSTSARTDALLRWAILAGALLTFVGLLLTHLDPTHGRREIALAKAFHAQVLDAPAPDITALRKDGTQVRLSDLRGKVVFVNFWATWCPPCRAEIPDLEQLAEKMKHVPFEILAVSSDDSWDDITTFLGGKESGMLIGLDPDRQAIAARYGTEKLPETYVVDRAGRLRLRFINQQPWTDERIHRYLEWLATTQ